MQALGSGGSEDGLAQSPCRRRRRHSCCDYRSRTNVVVGDNDDDSVCSRCKKTIDSVVSLFDECPIFQRQWNAQDDPIAVAPAPTTSRGDRGMPNNAPCWKRKEGRLEDCVRHLCDKQCFLKAFTPYRELYALHRRLKETPEIDLLIHRGEEWRCKLLKESLPPRVLFVHNDGKEFKNLSLVVKHYKQAKQESSPHKAKSERKRKASQAVVPAQKYPHATLAESVRSSAGLLEEIFAHDPWKLLLCTILLNRTQRAQVDHVLFEFLSRWPTPRHVADDASVDQVAQLLRPLGLHERRAQGIKKFSQQYIALVDTKNSVEDMEHLTKDEILGLFQCGEYSYDAYRIFVQRDTQVDPKDKALQAYVEYKLAVETAMF